MDFRVKTIVGGIEMLERADIVTKQEDGVTYQPPSISTIKLLDNATVEVMLIGSTPSDCLTFTINNPNKQSYDGETVELWLAPPIDDTASMKEMGSIEDSVGSTSSSEGIDLEGSDELDENDGTEGEDPTPEDLADAEATSTANIESAYTAFEGEPQTVADEDTDEAEEPEWVRVGTFFVQSQTNADDNSAVTLTCYDSMQKLNGRFTPTIRIATVQDMFDDLRAQALENLGVTIDAFDYDEDASRSITMPSPVTYREALGWFAGLMGGFATCDDDGSIGFALYGFTDGLYLDSALNYLNVDASGELELDGIQCDIGFIREDLLTSGFDADVSFKNPFMTQEILDSILETYKGIRFTGGALNMAWDNSIDAGSFIRIMTPDEYKNYLELQNALAEGGTEEELLSIKENMNSLGAVMLVSYQLIDFNGDATTTIASVCSSSTQNENKMTSPTDAKFNKVTAKIIETEQLIAGKADIEDLEAAQADIAHLQVGDLTIGGVTVNIYDLALAIKQSTMASESIWYIASDTVPESPTVRDPSSLGWDTIEPVYGPSGPAHLYSCMCVTYADDTLENPHFVWGDVHLIQSWEAAQAAYVYADRAQTAANNATSSANTALSQLSVIENIVDVINWFADHKKATTDTAVSANKTYYEYDAITGTLTAVEPAGTENPMQEGWYELDEAIANYVATRISETNDGLYVVGQEQGWKVLVSSGEGNYSAGIYLLDPFGTISQATTASGISFNENKTFTIGNSSTYIQFNPSNGGTIVINGGDKVQIGSGRTLDELVTIETTDELSDSINAVTDEMDVMNERLSQGESNLADIGLELDAKADASALAGVNLLVREYLGTNGYIQIQGSALVLGQGRFKTAITPQAMVFYDNNVEVASISNKELIINKTRVSNEMRMGNFVWTIKPTGKLILKHSEE